MKITRHGDTRYKAGGVLGPARWKVYDLIVALEGGFTFHTPCKGLKVQTGDAVVIPPGVGFHATINGPQSGNIWVTHFMPEKAEGLEWLKEPAATPPLHYFKMGADSPWAEALIQRISSVYPAGGSRNECHHLLPLLLHEIRTRAEQTAHSPIQDALAMAEEHGWKAITATCLAAWSGFSESHFRVRFQQEKGCTVGVYLKTRRMEEARRLLQSPSIPIKEISKRLGYSEASAFHHAFTAAYDCTPGAYRKRTVAWH